MFILILILTSTWVFGAVAILGSIFLRSVPLTNVLGSLILGFLVFPASLVKAPMMCCICSGVRLRGRSTAFPLVSGLGLDVDAMVFLLVRTASLSSDADPSSVLGVVEHAVC